MANDTMPDVPTLGVILAGGLGTRMGGGDKPLREIGGQSILARVIDRVAPQCNALIINANGDPARFADFGLPVVADSVPGHPGPLAGVLAGMDRAATHHPGTDWVLSAAGDCPFLPHDLVARLQAARIETGADLAVATSGAHYHSVIGLWRVALRESLRQALTVDKVRKIKLWTHRYRIVEVAWPTDPVDPFFNANRPEDLARAEELARLMD